MKRTVGFYILMVVTWPMQFFPLEFHFLISNLIYFLIYKVFGYRIKVVDDNLRYSFPLMSELERNEVKKKFYHNFTDMFIETLYFTHSSNKQTQKRLVVENIELMEKLLNDGRCVIMIAGHLGNWEYFTLFRARLNAQNFFVYKHLENKTFDQFYKKIRSQAGTALEMREAYRTLHAKAKSGNYLAFMMSDQRPLKKDLKHWITFLNQDTPVITGTERVARKTKAAVFFTEITRIKRGYQKIRFELITEDASKTDEYDVTHSFMRKLEESVRKYPDQYFWTHKRWKYKREEDKN